jgi:hypothetical protein
LRNTPSILFIAIDSIIPVRGKAAAGFDEFCATGYKSTSRAAASAT